MLVVGLAMPGCGSSSDIDTAEECISSFRAALIDDDGSMRAPEDDEVAWAAYQGSDEWEGRTPVCWINYSGPTDCHGFMLDLEGTWSPAEWVDSGSHPGACPPDEGHAVFDI